MKYVGVAILGLGVVGSGVYEILNEHKEVYKKSHNLDVEVRKILTRTKEKAYQIGITDELLVTNINEICNDDSISIVVEAMGGIKASLDYVTAVLKSKKSVVTSNKELYCKYGHILEKLAKDNKVGLYYEATVGGGIPIIRTLLDNLQGNNVKSILGIINGTTNYILSKMLNEKVSYDNALSEAQMLGYAEKDPTSDVDAYDSTYKLSILASLAFKTKIPYTKIYREGIRGVSLIDINYGTKLGYTLKLLAIGKNTSNGIEVRVHPTFIKSSHPLASVNDAFNAIFIKGDSVDDVMLYGRGAGKFPTGSAVVGDVLYAAAHTDSISYSPFENNENADPNVIFNDNFESAYYMRLLVNDTTGVLAKITAIFSKYNISVRQLNQYENGDNGVPLIIVTHITNEKNVRNAVEEINSLPDCGHVEAVIRVD